MEITVDELIHERQMALDREGLIIASSNYKSEITACECKITESQLKLEKFERELLKAKAYTENISNDKLRIFKNLLEENQLLRKNFLESTHLQLQLQLAKQLKEVFKSKYDESISGFTNSKDSVIDEKSAVEVQEMQKKIGQIDAEIAETMREKEYMKKKVVPVLESTLKLYEKNKLESEERVGELKKELKMKQKRTETHSASPVSSKSQNSKSALKPEPVKPTTKTPKSKAYMPSYLSHSKPNIKRSDRNSK